MNAWKPTAISPSTTSAGATAGFGCAPNLSVSHLSEDWKAEVLTPLIAHMAQRPIFAADRPSEAPGSVIFGYLTAKPVPDRQVANRAVSVSVSMDFAGHVA